VHEEAGRAKEGPKRVDGRPRASADFYGSLPAQICPGQRCPPAERSRRLGRRTQALVGRELVTMGRYLGPGRRGEFERSRPFPCGGAPAGVVKTKGRRN